ncbi:hypothetical protein GCM10023322_36500 [Rugosimonospora acidiphila]|uniref:Uncharacterized protein n=1 Tax=Rugosimonospora acidiphila TaxID=556531 RepID=A0ABP9RWP3_9ACTN
MAAGVALADGGLLVDGAVDGAVDGGNGTPVATGAEADAPAADDRSVSGGRQPATAITTATVATTVAARTTGREMYARFIMSVSSIQ